MVAPLFSKITRRLGRPDKSDLIVSEKSQRIERDDLPGGGERLFGELDQRLAFELVAAEIVLNQIIKKHYRRKHKSPAMRR